MRGIRARDREIYPFGWRTQAWNAGQTKRLPAFKFERPS